MARIIIRLFLKEMKKTPDLFMTVSSAIRIYSRIMKRTALLEKRAVRIKVRARIVIRILSQVY